MADKVSFNWKDKKHRTKKSKRRAAARNAPSRGMSLAQLQKLNLMDNAPEFRHAQQVLPNAYAQYGITPGEPHTQQSISRKLMKGGGSIRLPQMGKAMLPMILLALLTSGMGTGGNEDLDGMLG
tara:strand:- start:429 stop:800 length:372 start_codon:yes stop_codon:yes gene_type:complete